jgi:hypothetical protein
MTFELDGHYCSTSCDRTKAYYWGRNRWMDAELQLTSWGQEVALYVTPTCYKLAA